jgi:ribosomal protein S21
MIEVKKRQGEQNLSVVSRFIRRVKQSGILKESKKYRYSSRKQNLRARKISALYKIKKTEEFNRAKKLGLI